MAYFTELNGNSEVIRVIVVDDRFEADGENWCRNFFGGNNWKQTSYETHGGVHSQGKIPFRKNYAGIGYKYDSNRDAFIPPQPFASWIIDEGKGLWKAPKERLNDGNDYKWDENTVNWIKIINIT